MANNHQSIRQLLFSVTLLACCSVVRMHPAVAQEGHFDPACPIPFANIAPEPPGNAIDGQCGPEGIASKPESRLQNKAKNNLCGTGDPIRLTRFSFIQLQRAVDATDIEYGSAQKLPKDRTALEGLHTTSDGKTVGEGTVVQFSAFVLDAHYSNVSKGEGVNCKQSGQANNDIHVAMAEQSDADLCESITVEIIPHFRPAAWTPDVLEGLGRPVRITGQLFFDGSHKPCTEGHRASPARISVWEIHPVYGIDVCTNRSLASCRADDDSKWTPIHEWFGLEEEAEPGEEDE